LSSLAALLSRNFVLLWLANFLHWSLYGFQIVLPKYIKHQGGLEDDIGIIMAAFTAVSVAVLLGASLALFAAPWPGTMWLILPRLLQGLSLALFATASSVFMAAELPPDLMAAGMSYFLLSGMASGAFAPRLAEWVAQRFGYQNLFLLLAAACLLLMALLAGLREPKRSAARAPEREQEQRGAWRHPLLWLLVAVSFGYGAGRIPLQNFLPTYGLERGLENVGSFFLFHTIGGLAVRILLVPHADRWGYHSMLVGSLLLDAAAVYGLTYVGTYPDLYAAGFAAGAAHGAYGPMMSAYIARYFGRARRGVAFALVASARDIGQSGGSVGFGYLIVGMGYPVVWLGGAALIVLTAVVVLLGRALKREDVNAAAH